MLAVILSLAPADAQAQTGRELLSATFQPIALGVFGRYGCGNDWVAAGMDRSCTHLARLGDLSFDYRGQTLRFEQFEYTSQTDGQHYLEVRFEPVGSGGTANVRLDDGLTLTVGGLPAGSRSFDLDRQSASTTESRTTASSFRWLVPFNTFSGIDPLSLSLRYPLPRISVAPVRPVVTEGEDAAFTLTREPDWAEALSVSVAVTDENGALVSRAPLSVTFGAGATTATLRLATQDREGAQADAAVALTLQPGDAWVLRTPSAATVTVRDDDLQEVTASATPATVAHGEDAVFTVTRVGDLTAPLTVAATLTDGTRSPPVATPVGATFGAGVATATLRLATRDQEGAQADATVTLMLRDGAAYDLGDPSRATVTVRDEGRQPVTIADAAPVTEGGTLAFPVALTGSSDTQVTVNYTLAGTAAAGTDYAGNASGALTFAPGVTAGTIRVVTLDDEIDEPEETVRVRIASVARAGSFEAVRPGSIEATGRILDDDLPAVTVTADAPAVTEGEDAVFTLTRAGGLSEALEGPVTVTDPGMVLAAAAPSNVTFGAGDATVTLRLGTVDDEVDESDATVTLALGAGTTWRPGTPSAATVTVRDDDGTPPEVSIADAGSVDEGGTLTFPVRLSGTFHAQVEVDYTLAGTAVAGDDHDGAASGAVTFAPGETEQTIRLVTVDDDTDEPEETVEIALTAPAPNLATLGRAQATGRIRDDDLPLVTVAPVADAIVEGEDAEFVVTREGDLSVPLSLRYAIKDFRGTFVFFHDPPSFEVGASELRVSWPTQDDASSDGSIYYVLVELTPSSHYRLRQGTRAAAQVVVLDDDLPPVVSIADAPPVTEGGALAFPVTLSRPFSERIAVRYRLGGTAAAGDHDGGASGVLTFAPGETEQTVRLVTVDDGVVEPEETVEVTLSAPGSHLATLGRARATGRILDDDGTVEVTVQAVSERIVEGADAVFELARSGAVSGALDVSLRVADPDGVLASTAPSGARFGVGETTATLRLATRDVAGAGSDALVTVTLADGGAAWGLGTPSTASVTVRDDDTAPTVSIADAGAVTEGGVLAFPVTLSGPFNRKLDVLLSFSPQIVSHNRHSVPGLDDWDLVPSEHVGVAIDAADFGTNVTPRELSFDPGVTERILRFVTLQDGFDEADETVTVTLVRVSPARAGRLTATGRILDGDRPAVTVAARRTAVTEGGQAAFRFRRTGGELGQALEVAVSVTDAGAVLAGAAPTGVTFAADAATATLRLDTVNGSLDGADATLTLTLRPGAEYVLHNPARASVTVRDDDRPVVTVAAAADTVMEGEALAFTLTRTGDPSNELTVTGEFGIAPDVFVETRTATFAAGAATARLDRTAPDVGADTTYVLALQAGAGYVLGDPSRASVTVRDDDAMPSVSIADADAVTEGGALEFPVTLSSPFHAEITVDWRVGDGGSATAGDDHAGAASGAVTFAPRVTARTIRIATTDDAADEPEETVEVALSLPDPDPGLATLGTAAATGRILDDDGPSQVTVAAVAATVAEGADAAFTLTRANGDASGTLTVAVAVTDAGAVLAGAAPSSVAFSAGASTATLRLATDDDAADEADTPVTVTLQAGTDYSLGAPHQATVTVRDDDLPSVTVAADATAVTEGEAAAFTLTRAGVLSAPLVVPVAVTDADGVLAEEAPVSVTFSVDASTATLRLATDDDAADEAAAPVTLTVQAGAGHVLGAPHQATVTVRDDDLPSVTVAADAARVTEGEAAAFTLTRAGDLSVPLVVSVLFGDADSVLLPGAPASVTFEVDAATAALRPGTDDDAADEADAAVTVTLQAGAGYDLGDPFTASVTVRDDDLPSVTVAAVSERIVEGELIRFTVTRTGDLSAALTVTTLLGLSPDTLTLDFPVTIGAGQSTGRFGELTASNNDADTTYWLGLQTSADYRPGEPALAMVTALNHQQPPDVSVADADAAPEGGALEFPVALSRPFHQSLTVAYTLGGTAQAADYTDAAGGSVTFPKGEMQRTIRLATTDDEADEAEEAVTVTLADGADYQVGTPATATGRILDDDGPSQVTVAAVAATVTEGAAAAFTLTRAGDRSGAPEVSFTVEDAAGVLAAPPPTGVTFEADATTVRVTLATVDDRVDEADAVLTLTLHDGTGYGLGAPSAATVTVRDDDAPPTVSVADAGSVTEGDPLDYVVRLSHPSAAEIPVRYTLDGTAQARDYIDAAGGVVTFAPETTEQTIRLATVDDDADEPAETVEVTLAAPDPRLAVPGTSTATGTIEDDDLPVVTAAADAATVTEGAEAAFTLTRAGDLSVALEVSFTVEDAGGALAPGAPVGATFGVGAATVPVTLASADDGVDEADADVVLVLQPDTAAWREGSPSRATVTVRDDDLPVVTAAAAADAVAEGAEAVFTLTRTEGELSQALSVTFTIEDPAGALPSTSPGATFGVTFGAGKATATVRLLTRDDTTTGDDATVTLILADGRAWDPGDPRRASVTVRDNDARPSVSIADAGSAPEGGTLAFPVTLSGPYRSEIAVNYTLGGTAAAGSDYEGAASGSVTFAPGEVRKVLSRRVLDDDVDEPEETVEVTLGRSVATGRILDDDLPEVTVAVEAATVTEGADAVFTLTRAGDRSVTLEVAVEVADGVLAARAPDRVTFEVDAATATLRLGTRDDTADEPDAPVTLTLLLDADYRLGDPSEATVTVEDDDLPEVTVAVEAATVTEGEDVVFTLTRAGVLSEALEVPVAVTDTDGVLASTAPDRVTFEAAAATTTLRLPTRDDTAEAPDATVTLALGAGAGHAAGDPSQVTVTVRDDELRTVSVADATPVTEGGTLAFPVTLSNRSATAIAVAYVVAGVDGAVRGADYADVRIGFLTFAPGEVRKTISLPTLDDGLFEVEEGVRITLSAPDPALATLGRAEATGRITDDDLPTVTIAADSERVIEGEALRVTVTRTGDLSANLVVTIQIGPSPDTTTHTAHVTIPRGASSRRTNAFRQAPGVGADTVYYLRLAPGAGHALGDPSTITVTVLDDDAPRAVSVADADAVAEGGTLAFPVTMSGPYRSEVTVNYTLGGTAVAGTDYTGAASGSVTFPKGAMRQTIRVATTDDATEGREETVEVTLSLPDPDPGRATLGTTTATGRILDDDAPPSVTVADADAVAEGGTLAFPVTMSGPYRSEIAVNYTLGGTAAAGSDYEGAATGSVTFAPGTIERTIRVATTDDDADEPEETVELALSLPDPDPGVATLGVPSTATGRILLDADDLPVVTVAAAPATVTEGEAAVFTLTRAGVVSEALAVSLTVTDADGVLVSTALPTGATFRAGATAATVRLGTQDDDADEADATVTLALADGAGYRTGDPHQASVTVRDDDLPSVSVADAAPVTEGGTLAFAVRLSNRLDAPVTVGYRLGGTATPGEDHDGVALGSVTFAPGATERTIRIVTQDDAIGEDEERVLVTLAAPGPSLALGRSVAEGRIRDDDLPSVTVAAVADAVGEGADAAFALTRAGALSAALEVTVAVADAAGVLASAAPTAVTFEPGATVSVLRLPTRDDTVGHADATVTLTLADGAAWTAGDPSEAAVTVRDDDPPVVTVVPVADAVMDGEAAAFALTRTARNLSAALEVTVAVTDTAGVLASAAPTAVTFEADAATAELRLPTREDAVGEVDAAVTLRVAAGAGYAPGAPSQATVTVRDDGLPYVSIADAATVDEGGTLAFAVSLAHPHAAAVPVVWRVGGGTATADDYTGSASGVAVFAPGDVRTTISVATVDDDADEPEETVEVAIFVAAPGLPGSSTEATGRIRDDDLPVVTVETPTDTIVEEQPIPFVVRRTGDTSGSLDVVLHITDGGAFWRPPLTDADRRGLVFTFAPGVSELAIGATWHAGDSNRNYTTTVTVRSGPSYVRGTPYQATVTVRADDRAADAGIPRVTVADADAVAEGGTLAFPVRLDGPSEQEVRVTYLLSGSATAGYDYQGAASGSITFAPGDLFEEIALETTDDVAEEPEETVEVEIGIHADTGAGAALGSTTRATGRIRRSDLPVVTVAALRGRIVEDDEAAFTLTRTGDRSASLTVDALLTDGTSPSPVATPVRVTFAAGDATATLRLDTRDDTVAEADASVLLVLLAGAEYALGDPSRASVTVRDDERRPEVSIADAAPVREGGTLAFPVRLSVPGAEAITVGYALAGTATAGTDYAGGASGSVTFAPGTIAHTIRVATLADGVDEPEESVRVRVVTVTVAGSVEVVGSGGGTASGDGTATGAILDGDLPSVTIAPVAAAVAEGEDAVFTLTRAGVLSGSLAVSFAVADAAGVLATAAPAGAAGATFAPGAATVRVALATDDDTVDEAHATLTLTLQAGADYDRGDPHQASVTVRDDDPHEVTVAADAVTEGEDATFVLTRAGGDLSAPLAVSFVVADAAGVLATAAPTGATFEAGAATARVVLATVDDEADAAHAALTLTLQAGAGYDLGVPHQASVTVRDDDLPVVTVAPVAARIVEGAAAAFTLTRVGDLSVTLEVPVATTDAGAALAGTAPTAVTFRAGDAEAALRLDTADDATVEADTAVTLTVREGAGHALGDPSSASVTVRDDDTLPDVSIADAATVTEGETLVFPVTLTAPYDEEDPDQHRPRSGRGTATFGDDYGEDHGLDIHPAGGDGADDPIHDGRRRPRRGGGDGRGRYLEYHENDHGAAKRGDRPDPGPGGSGASGGDGGGGRGRGHRRRGGGVHPDADAGSAGVAGGAGCGHRCRFGADGRGAVERDLPRRGEHGRAAPGHGQRRGRRGRRRGDAGGGRRRGSCPGRSVLGDGDRAGRRPSGGDGGGGCGRGHRRRGGGVHPDAGGGSLGRADRAVCGDGSRDGAGAGGVAADRSDLPGRHGHGARRAGDRGRRRRRDRCRADADADGRRGLRPGRSVLGHGDRAGRRRAAGPVDRRCGAGDGGRHARVSGAPEPRERHADPGEGRRRRRELHGGLRAGGHGGDDLADDGGRRRRRRAGDGRGHAGGARPGPGDAGRGLPGHGPGPGRRRTFGGDGCPGRGRGRGRRGRGLHPDAEERGRVGRADGVGDGVGRGRRSGVGGAVRRDLRRRGGASHALPRHARRHRRRARRHGDADADRRRGLRPGHAVAGFRDGAGRRASGRDGGGGRRLGGRRGESGVHPDAGGGSLGSAGGVLRCDGRRRGAGGHAAVARDLRGRRRHRHAAPAHAGRPQARRSRYVGDPGADRWRGLRPGHAVAGFRDGAGRRRGAGPVDRRPGAGDGGRHARVPGDAEQAVHRVDLGELLRRPEGPQHGKEGDRLQ